MWFDVCVCDESIRCWFDCDSNCFDLRLRCFELFGFTLVCCWFVLLWFGSRLMLPLLRFAMSCVDVRFDVRLIWCTLTPFCFGLCSLRFALRRFSCVSLWSAAWFTWIVLLIYVALMCCSFDVDLRLTSCSFGVFVLCVWVRLFVRVFGLTRFWFDSIWFVSLLIRCGCVVDSVLMWFALFRFDVALVCVWCDSLCVVSNCCLRRYEIASMLCLRSFFDSTCTMLVSRCFVSPWFGLILSWPRLLLRSLCFGCKWLWMRLDSLLVCVHSVRCVMYVRVFSRCAAALSAWLVVAFRCRFRFVPLVIARWWCWWFEVLAMCCLVWCWYRFTCAFVVALFCSDCALVRIAFACVLCCVLWFALHLLRCVLRSICFVVHCCFVEVALFVDSVSFCLCIRCRFDLLRLASLL